MPHRKTPDRPGNEISQSYNDGLVTIYRLTDGGKPGYLPQPLPSKIVTLHYAEMRLGLTRYYAAKQNNVQVERVLRVPRGANIAAQDIAVTEDGQEYDIDLIQSVDGIWPPSLDLTLAKTSQKRIVPNSDTSEGQL